MDFSEALIAVRHGIRITRKDWDSTFQFICYRRGYPEGVAISPATAVDTGLPRGAVRKFAPYLMLCDAQGVFVPWQPTQADILADDWKNLD